jgi:hypothetical protein
LWELQAFVSGDKLSLISGDGGHGFTAAAANEPLRRSGVGAMTEKFEMPVNGWAPLFHEAIVGQL